MRGTAVIVGASLSGLMTALALSRAGLTVSVLEKSADTGRTGAAIHVEEATDDMYKSIDRARDRLERLIKRELEKKREPTGHPFSNPASRPVSAAYGGMSQEDID